jgi:hypothetical protein
VAALAGGCIGVSILKYAIVAADVGYCGVSVSMFFGVKCQLIGRRLIQYWAARRALDYKCNMFEHSGGRAVLL